MLRLFLVLAIFLLLFFFVAKLRQHLANDKIEKEPVDKSNTDEDSNITDINSHSKNDKKD